MFCVVKLFIPLIIPKCFIFLPPFFNFMIVIYLSRKFSFCQPFLWKISIYSQPSIRIAHLLRGSCTRHTVYWMCASVLRNSHAEYIYGVAEDCKAWEFRNHNSHTKNGRWLFSRPSKTGIQYPPQPQSETTWPGAFFSSSSTEEVQRRSRRGSHSYTEAPSVLLLPQTESP